MVPAGLSTRTGRRRWSGRTLRPGRPAEACSGWSWIARRRRASLSPPRRPGRWEVGTQRELEQRAIDPVVADRFAGDEERRHARAEAAGQRGVAADVGGDDDRLAAREAMGEVVAQVVQHGAAQVAVGA